MSISVSSAVSQANTLGTYEGYLRQVKNSLLEYRNTLNSCWKAEEMAAFNTAIEMAVRDINNAINSLNSLKSDVVDVAYEIKREEERREAEARARAEAAARSLAGSGSKGGGGRSF